MKLNSIYNGVVKAFSPEWIWRGILTLTLLANLYLQQRFVLREEYKNDKDSLSRTISGLNDTISNLNLNLALLKQSSSTLSDHEARLRILEHR